MKSIFTPNLDEKQDVKRRLKNKNKERDWKGTFVSLFKKIVITGFILFLITLSWSIYKFMWKSSYFTLQKIEVNETKHVSKDRIITDSGVLPKTNLVKISTEEVKERVEKNPWIQTAYVIKRHPSGLSIRVIERKPLALVVGDTLMGIDENGYLLPGLKPENAQLLPIITVKTKLLQVNSHRVTSREMNQALFLLTEIKKSREELFSRISEVDITNPENIKIYTMEDGTEIRMGNENLEYRLDRLYKFLDMSNDRELVHEYIDLRFEKQGVVTKPKSVRKQKNFRNNLTSV